MTHPTQADAMAALEVIEKRLDGYQTAKETLRAYIERQTVDVEALKREALAEFMKGRSSKQLEDIAFDIISETFNWLKMKNHLAAALVAEQMGGE